MRTSFLAGLVLLAACGGEPQAQAADASAPNAPVLLQAHGTTTDVRGSPNCRIEFRTVNRGDLPLAVFSGRLEAVHATRGEALNTVSLPQVGVAELNRGQLLAPGESGSVWPLNIKGLGCDQVHVDFGKFLCSFQGRPCGLIAVEQQGLAGISAPQL